MAHSVTLRGKRCVPFAKKRWKAFWRRSNSRCLPRLSCAKAVTTSAAEEERFCSCHRGHYNPPIVVLSRLLTDPYCLFLCSPASRRNPESLQGCPHGKLFNSLTFQRINSLTLQRAYRVPF